MEGIDRVVKEGIDLQSVSDQTLIILVRKAKQHIYAMGMCVDCDSQAEGVHRPGCSVGKAIDEAERRIRLGLEQGV